MKLNIDDVHFGKGLLFTQNLHFLWLDSIENMLLDVNCSFTFKYIPNKNLFDNIKYKVAHIYVSFYV
jgi:hypothetical protein